MRNPGCYLCAFLIAAFACSEAGDRQSPKEGSPAPGVIERDSAGIRIIESSTPAWGGDGWRLSDTPTVIIGQREGDERYLFGSIGGGVVLGDGRIAVLDRLAGHAGPPPCAPVDRGPAPGRPRQRRTGR